MVITQSVDWVLQGWHGKNFQAIHELYMISLNFGQYPETHLPTIHVGKWGKLSHFPPWGLQNYFHSQHNYIAFLQVLTYMYTYMTML